MGKENPNFYAIIPADVRYNKNIVPGAKLLYGEITALANKTGYCYASNSYFSGLYNVTTRQITEWINQLISVGFIESKIEKATGNTRYISLLTYRTKVTDPIEEKFHTYRTKVPDPIELKFQNNNTINNTSIISLSEEEKKDKEKDFVGSIEEARKFINFGVLSEKYYFKNLENCLIDWWLYSEEKGKMIKKMSCHLSFERWLRGGKPEQIEQEKKAYEESKRKKEYKIDPYEEDLKKKKEIDLKIQEWRNQNPSKLAEFSVLAEKESIDKSKGNERLKKAFKLSIENREIKKLLKINL